MSALADRVEAAISAHFSNEGRARSAIAEVVTVLAEALPDIAYSVANSKLGEGPSVRCEGPTEFEVNLAREWTRRVLKAIQEVSGGEHLHADWAA